MLCESTMKWVHLGSINLLQVTLTKERMHNDDPVFLDVLELTIHMHQRLVSLC